MTATTIYFKTFCYGAIFLICMCVYLEERYLSASRSNLQTSEKRGVQDKWLARKLPIPALELCQDLPVSRVKAPQPNEWQTIVPREYFVYSAFSDPRLKNETIIRIFGIMLRDLNIHRRAEESFWCQIWVENYKAPVIQRSYYSIQGHAKEKYVSVEWTCHLASPPEKLPHITVALAVNNSCSDPNNMVAVHRLSPTSKVKRNFTVCLAGVVKNEYSNYHQLVEWAEVNRMYGADYFVLYKENASNIIDPYVNHYSRQGLMETIPWKLPDLGDVGDFDVIWNLGQVTAINDCIYRNMYTSKFVVSVDFDEMIVPYGNSLTWEAMMRDAGCTGKSVFLARNAFFGIGPNWDQTGIYAKNKTISDILHLQTLTHTKQDTYVNFFPKRSKFITKADVVSMAGIHNVKGIFGVNNRNPHVCKIRLAYGRLHHYRDPRWEDIQPIENTYMYKYADDIIARTKAVHQKVLGVRL